MNALISLFTIYFLLISTPITDQIPEPDDHFRDQFNRHFNYASMRILSLAEEMPEEYYNWRPGDGVMSFSEVCMHIARYNYYYPVVTLGLPEPEGINLDQMESITDKETILTELERSIEYVRAIMEDITSEELNEPAQLYGWDVTVQAVYMQLITHKSEHLGQAISYARVNGVVPPWSR
jgi:uncharacterized damage-inducible protein DinB